jgi:carboxyl-terminal processing protease
VPEREADEKYALPASVIDANKYYKPLPALPVAAAESVAKKEMASSAYFKYVQQYIEHAKTASVKKDYSLYIEDAWLEKKKKDQQERSMKEPESEKAIYTVIKPASQKQREHDSELNAEWKEDLLNDAYVRVAFKLMAAMKQ